MICLALLVALESVPAREVTLEALVAGATPVVIAKVRAIDRVSPDEGAVGPLLVQATVSEFLKGSLTTARIVFPYAAGWRPDRTELRVGDSAIVFLSSKQAVPYSAAQLRKIAGLVGDAPVFAVVSHGYFPLIGSGVVAPSAVQLPGAHRPWDGAQAGGPSYAELSVLLPTIRNLVQSRGANE